MPDAVIIGFNNESKTGVTVKVRKATDKDVPSVEYILNSSRLEYLPYAQSVHSIEEIRRWVQTILIPGGRVVIAQLDNKDVGVLASSITDDAGWIDQLYVAPGYIRKGIGTRLLKHGLDQLPATVRLWTFQQNIRATKFYEYHGFRAIEYTDGKNNEEKCPAVLLEFSS